jgi:1-acyl-sn-glycerol-3-phosphate acyltransferase
VSAPPRQDLPRVLVGVARLTLFGLLFVAAALTTPLVPGLTRRRRFVSAFSRVGLGALGLRVSIDGLDRLPGESCVLVANHASYLDGVVMQAMLPPTFAFVIKREAASLPVAGWLLKLIGSEFLARHHRGDRHKDARRLMRRASAGQSLVFFPEGTFTSEAGLRKFHAGAFATAARAGSKVVPAVLHGTRRALPNNAWLPKPGRIRVEILEPLAVEPSRTPVEELRDAARRSILSKLGEPDLEDAPAPASLTPGA